MRPDTYEVPFPMLLNRAFEILLGFRNTRTYNGIQIKNLQRILVIKCLNTCDSEEWTQHLLNLTNQAKDFISTTLQQVALIHLHQYTNHN
ncbi:unnamed protein product [Rotaria sp. Silwood1]|nr:unnamed protein product [Rotaria sp. Silwood1]